MITATPPSGTTEIPTQVAVIGSGLSALGAIRALVGQGVCPVVLDVGEELEKDKAQRAAALASLTPGQWTTTDRQWLNSNPTVESGSRIPKKLVFGSGFFYGKGRKEAPIQAEGNLPPLSYALGGLSAGWGAAVLPPHLEDLHDWPVSADELHRNCKAALAGLPYSAVDDGLSTDFPLLADRPAPIRLSRAGKTFLAWLSSGLKIRKGRFLFGQARLLVQAPGQSKQHGCRYCGQCSSGCAYGAIFKAGDEIMALHQAGRIQYLSGRLVDSLEEHAGGVRLHVHNLVSPGSMPEEMHFDRVFVAAGAVNSTRIVMKSLQAFERPLELKTRGGFVLPVASLRGIPRDWPDCNTQPEIFLEFRNPGQHWVHAQVSLENELVVQKLGVHLPPRGLLSHVKRVAARRLFFLLVNYHSDHSGTYELQLRRPSLGSDHAYLHTRQKSTPPQLGTLLSTMTLLGRNLLRLGCLPLLPLARLNSGSYHVGCTLPMSKQPKAWNETDTLGRLGSWQRIHLVDTSVFPSLPGTTIGLLAMANAWRIADQSLQRSLKDISHRENS